MDRPDDRPQALAPAGPRLKLSTTARAVWAFLIYSYVVTVLSAAWFVRRAAALDGGDLDVGSSIAWQGAIYALWLPAAGVVWLIQRLFGTGLKALAAATAAGLVIVPLEAAASLAIDSRFRGVDLDWEAGMLGRAPVAILIYTAIIAFGAAAVHARRAEEARRQIARLETALADARAVADEPADPAAERLMVSTGSKQVPVSLAEVEWFASAGNYVVVHWGEREGLVRETLKALEARLDPRLFARSHRTTLVNLSRVATVQPLSDGSWRLTLDSGTELVVSRTFRDDLLKRLGR
ncbi:DNA-binding LytR/AlgR family response regulator [Brevundimonas alba]|uniref:DNA-binding LytR/AlgR family response regulator n=1 Tax=Brevundimonas alba TaxID=74314 RepID=A0A7X6BM20_9CAUL|nr:LytTR family DNA-binding domain-containing protein [Brevundimonas alba]NJC39892.1 DNA-binding LytR/AlgR family response regulator [Brevundimonas alba]